MHVACIAVLGAVPEGLAIVAIEIMYEVLLGSRIIMNREIVNLLE